MDQSPTTRTGVISGSVIDAGGSKNPIRNARILVYRRPEPREEKEKQPEERGRPRRRPKPDSGYTAPPPPPERGPCAFPEAFTDAEGQFAIRDVPPGAYWLVLEAFGYRLDEEVDVESSGCPVEAVCFEVPLNLQVTAHVYPQDCAQAVDCELVTAGATVLFRADWVEGTHYIPDTPIKVNWDLAGVQPLDDMRREVLVGTAGMAGPLLIKATLKENPEAFAIGRMMVLAKAPQPIAGNIGVNLRRSAVPPTSDQALWVAIRNRTRAISFSGTGAPRTGYRDFIDRVLCKGEPLPPPGNLRLTREFSELGNHVHGVGAYELLKTATEAFLLLECGVAIRDGALFDPGDEAARLGEPVTLGEISARLAAYLGQGRLPYIDRVVRTAFPGIGTGRVFCHGVLTSRVDGPCLLELIWSYWHEEGMLAQTINAVSRRFQNVRGPGERDPLAHLEIDPLRPLNNLLWGHIQDEWSRLTVKRRAYEYDHHYGLTLYGKAVPSFRPADSRSKFLEGFHNLLHLCSVFFKEDNDTTVIADGYPLLNALKEVHLLLAQGAHNQFGDLPWTARVEMLIQEWLLGRQEMRDFLQSRAMVPYKEEWMPQVDTMKTLQGWSDVTVTHFRDLAVYGEQTLLSIRYGDWIDINDENSAKNWARYWRPEIQGYLHGYRAATGVDLTNPDTVDPTMPSVHLQKRLATQRTR